MKAYGFDQGAARDVGVLFLTEKAKTLDNGTCPGHHNGVVIMNETISLETFHCMASVDVTAPLKARDYKDPIVVLDRAAYNQGEKAKYDFEVKIGGGDATSSRKGSGSGVLQKVGALCHDDYKFPQQQQIEQGKVVIEEMGDEYIVRRLLPIECGRLQGFPDGWGNIDPKEDFTEEEYQFWLEVRNHWAEINGKQTKEYTKEQMVKWYNKLHTDSAEYKMWGNGVGLPNVLYVMEGIADIERRGL